MSNQNNLKLREELANIRNIEPAAELYGRIFQNIESRRRQQVYLSIFSHLAGLVGVSSLIFVYWPSIIAEISQSQLIELLKISFVSPGAILINWQGVAWYAVETLPVYSLASGLAFLWVALATLKNISEIININRIKLKV